MDRQIVEKLKSIWRDCNKATLGFAESVPENLWQTRPFRPRFKSYAWEFACLARTRMCYLKALKTGELSFSHQDDIPDKGELETSPKQKVILLIKKLNQDISNEIDNLNSRGKFSRVIWLLQHERLHQGKLIIYHSQLGLKIPLSFIKTWGESNFPKHK